jgi:hypothetical protein
MIESAIEAATRQVYDEDYVDLVSPQIEFETNLVPRGDAIQIRAVIRCENSEYLETVSQRITIGWNGLNQLEGPLFVTVCDSRSEATAILDPKWRGLL